MHIVESKALQDKIDLEALDQLFNRIRKEVFSNMIVPLVVMGVMWGQVDHLLLFAWGVFMFIGIGMNYFVAVLYFRQAEPITDPKEWGRRMSTVMLYFGLLWVFAIFNFYIDGSVGHQVFLVAIVIVFSLGSVMVGIYWFPMFYLLAVPLLIALMVRFAMEGTVEYWALSILMLWTLLGTGALAKMLNAKMRSEISLRHESVFLNESLKEKTQLALQATQDKSKFLAAASHDLRQPLHTMSLFLDVLKDSKSDEERLSIFSSMDLSLNAIRKLFDSLLDISRLDADVVHPDLSHFNISEMLDKLVHEFESMASHKNLKFKMHARSLAVVSDPLLLERILRNLLSNAIRYTDSGSVLLSCRKRGNDALLQVWDTGIGVPEDQQENIFLEFKQLKRARRGREEGVGLGLSLVKRLCNLLDHPLGIKSIVNKGTVFSVCIPLGDSNLIQNRRSSKRIHTWELTDRRILVIDDEKEILLAMESLLLKWGCDVKTAESLDEAIAILQDSSWLPEIILSDYRFHNEEQGIDILNHLRNQFGSSIPCVLITGDTAVEQMDAVKNSDYTVLQKPVRPTHLRSVLQYYLSDIND